VVGILGLQRADQEFELRKPAQILEITILQEKRPAGEAAAHAPLQPIKSRLALPGDSEDARQAAIDLNNPAAADFFFSGARIKFRER